MKFSEDYQMLLSTISHEIRNPLTLINSYLQLLADSYPEITSCTYWDTIHTEMEHLRLLLQDISSYQNSIILCPQPIDFADWLAEYKNTILPLLKHSKITFDCETEEDLPLIEVDVRRFRQVFDNLVRNSIEALNICQKSNPRLIIKAFLDGDMLCITVTDNGYKIPAEQISTLFDPFVTHKSCGTGLGLPIAKRIIESHQGTITLACNSADKTTFEIRLPIKNLQ